MRAYLKNKCWNFKALYKPKAIVLRLIVDNESKMSRIALILCTGLCIILAPHIIAQTSFQPISVVHNPKMNSPQYAFQKGEFLEYRIHWGAINAGIASLEVSGKTELINGRKCFHVICKGYSTGSVDALYKVRDTYESFIDEETLVSRRFNRDIQEGGYKSYREVFFDQENQMAYEHNISKGKVKTFKVPANIQDVISTFYYARSNYDHSKLQPGDKISLKNFIDEKTFNLEAIVLKKEKIKIGKDEYNAIRMKIAVEEAGLMTDGSKITFWVSDDKNLIPLSFRSKLFIGSLRADLISVKNLRHPFISKLAL